MWLIGLQKAGHFIMMEYSIVQEGTMWYNVVKLHSTVWNPADYPAAPASNPGGASHHMKREAGYRDSEIPHSETGRVDGASRGNGKTICKSNGNKEEIMIDITLLGTSALVPLPDRAETAAQLVCGGHTILFDCGEGTQTAARKAGVSLIKTDIIALTHYHGDHIFGLPGLLQTMSIMGRTAPLTIVGPGNIEKELEHIVALTGWLPYELMLVTIPEDGIELNQLSNGWPDGARLIPFPTKHRVISQGYVFELPRAGKFLPEKAKELGVPINQWRFLQKGESVQVGEQAILPEMVLGAPRKGLKVVFSGDTAACEALEKAAQGADLLLCEATYGENEQEQLAADYGHMNFAQAGILAARAQVKRLWLMHYSQRMEDPVTYLPNAQAFYANAECGFDGKAVTLQFEKE